MRWRAGTAGMAVFAALVAAAAAAQPAPEPTLTHYSASHLRAAKAAAGAGDADMRLAVESLVRDADAALKQRALSVTSKPMLPPSGDRHDFMSLAPYWWPDPKSKDGLPYIRRDGEVNPEREKYPDRESFYALNEAVRALGLGYYFTGREQYAEHAARLLRTWFVAPDTRMNPNLNFAEAVKGRNDGRGAGIIQFHRMPSMLDAVGLLRGSKAWTQDDDRAFVEWCRAYLNWLRTSANGKDEQDSANNHGTWYDVQLVSLALFTGDRALAVRVLEEARRLRVAGQIEPDGRQPKELERTRALGYSTFNILAFTTLAAIGANAGVDLWHFQTPDGRSIRKAIDWMVPYYTGAKPWPHQQISPWEPDDAVAALMAAGTALDASYRDVARRISKSDAVLQRSRLVF